MPMLVGLHLTHMPNNLTPDCCVTQQWLQSSFMLDRFVPNYVFATLNLTGCRKAAEAM